MIKKIATFVYVVLQLVFFAAALALLKDVTDAQASMTPVGACVLLVVFYTLSTFAVRVFDVVLPYLPTGVKKDD